MTERTITTRAVMVSSPWPLTSFTPAATPARGRFKAYLLMFVPLAFGVALNFFSSAFSRRQPGSTPPAVCGCGVRSIVPCRSVRKCTFRSVSVPGCGALVFFVRFQLAGVANFLGQGFVTPAAGGRLHRDASQGSQVAAPLSQLSEIESWQRWLLRWSD